MKKNSLALGTLIRLILGLLLLLLGLWLWTKTLGTQLLFTDVTIGRVSRFWFIPVVIGLILLMTAAYSVVRKQKPENEGKEEQAPAEGETVNAEQQSQSAAESDGTEEQVLAEAEPVVKESQPSAETEAVIDESMSQSAAQAVDTGQQIPAEEEIL